MAAEPASLFADRAYRQLRDRPVTLRLAPEARDQDALMRFGDKEEPEQAAKDLLAENKGRVQAWLG